MNEFNNNGMMPAANSDVSEDTKKGLRRIGVIDRYLSRNEQPIQNVADPAYTSMMPGDTAAGMPASMSANMPAMPGGYTDTYGAPVSGMPYATVPGYIQGMPNSPVEGIANRKNATAIDRSVAEQERLQQKNNGIAQKVAALRAQDAQLYQEMTQLMQRNNTLMSEICALQNQVKMNPMASSALLMQIQHRQTESTHLNERWQNLRSKRMELQVKLAELGALWTNNYQTFGQSRNKQAALQQLVGLQQQGLVPAEVYYDSETETLAYARATDVNVRKWLLWRLCKSQGLISYPEAIVQLIRMEEPLTTTKEQDGTCRHACLMNLLEIRHLPVNTAYYGEVQLSAALLLDPQTLMPTNHVTPTETLVEFAYCPQCAKVYYWFDNSENIY